MRSLCVLSTLLSLWLSSHGVQAAAMEPRITAAAQAAASAHYDAPDAGLVAERYQRFMAGVNREWIAEAHKLKILGFSLQPEARFCEEQAAALKKSAQTHPFSLHLALLESRCAEQLKLDMTKFDKRLEVNFQALLRDQKGTSLLNPIPAFSYSEVTAIEQLLGASVVSQEFRLDRFDRLPLQVLYQYDGPKQAGSTAPARSKPLKLLYFDLLAEDLAPQLDLDRFLSSAAKIRLVLEALRGLRDTSIHAKLGEKVLSTTDVAAVLQWVRLQYPEHPLLARSALMLCSESRSMRCSEQDLEPLLQLAEQGNPVALASLASERFLGLVSKANPEEANTFLAAAEAQLGASVFHLLIGVAAIPAQEIGENMLSWALQGDVGAQGMLAVLDLENVLPPSLQKAWDQRPQGLVKSKAVSTLIALKARLKAEQSVPAADYCEVARLFTLFRSACFEDQSLPPSTKQALLERLSVSALIPEAERDQFSRELTRLLYRNKRFQAALDAAIGESFFIETLPAEIGELALKGFKPSDIFNDFPERIKNPKRLAILQRQFAAGATADPLNTLIGQCRKQVAACHAAIPLAEHMTGAQRQEVIPRAAEDDPSGAYSNAAELITARAFEAVEDSQIPARSSHDSQLPARSSRDSERLAAALDAIDLMIHPTDELLNLYARQRCTSTDAAIFAPMKTFRWVSRMNAAGAPWWLRHIGSICLAANKQFEMATKMNAGLPSPELQIPLAGEVSTLKFSTQRLFSVKQFPSYAADEHVALPKSVKLVPVEAGSKSGPHLQAGLEPIYAQLIRMEQTAKATEGRGFRFHRRIGFAPNTVELGVDEIRFTPSVFLRELRVSSVNSEAKMIAAVGSRICQAPMKFALAEWLRSADGSSLFANQEWRCAPGKFELTDVLPLNLQKSVLLAAQTRDARCGNQACKRLNIAFLPSQSAMEVNTLEHSALQYLASQLTVYYDAQSLRLHRAVMVEPGGRSEYRFEFDQPLSQTSLPSRCVAKGAAVVKPSETASSRQRAETDAGSQSEVTGKRTRRNHRGDEPLLVLKLDDKQLRGKTVADLLTMAAQEEAPVSPDVADEEICRY